jgi:hypothetical protein
MPPGDVPGVPGVDPELPGVELPGLFGFGVPGLRDLFLPPFPGEFGFVVPGVVGVTVGGCAGVAGLPGLVAPGGAPGVAPPVDCAHTPVDNNIPAASAGMEYLVMESSFLK